MSTHPPPLVDASALETLTRRLGHEIFDRIRGSSPWVFQPEWWEEKLLQQCMQNEWFKVQSFRFIDVLPMMRDDRDVARHLREYFAAPVGANGARRAAAGHNAARRGSGNGAGHGAAHAAPDAADLHDLAPPASGAGFVDWISRAMDFEHLDSLRARVAAWFARRGSVKMAHRFIAGSTPEEAIRTIRRMRDQRLAFTIDVLGEAALSEAESEHYHAIYLRLIRSLCAAARGWPEIPQIDVGDAKPLARVNVSVKLTSLYSQSDAIDPDASKRVLKERLRPLLREGMQHGAHVHIDMEHYAIKDLTLELCREVFLEDEFRDYPHFGIVLQAYLRDADRDVAETIEYARNRGTPFWVRLVKGAYWDTETVHAEQQHWPCPVFEQKWESDACYERCTRALLENWQFVHTAFASHNVRSLAHALALKRLIGVPSWAFELQMLYGMGDPIKRACRDLGERCRIYTPYGELLPGMAYLIRRLLENTANESFLRHSSTRDVSEDTLLEAPAEIGRRTPPIEKPPKLLFEFEEPIMDPFENVPNTDFSRRNGRDALAGAIREVRAKIGREVPLVIGGERIVTGQWVESVNPSKPAEVIGRIALADAASTERAVDLAFDTFKQWRSVPPHERAEYLFEVARIMERRRHELSAVIALECGKPWREADADVSESIDFCNYYGKEMIRIADNLRRRDMPGETNELFYTPRGVVAVISPWNFPLAILTGMTTAALVTGNAVIIKPAESASVIASKLAEMFEQARLPKGVLTYLPGKGSVVGEIMVKHPKVAMIAFTGSREVGCRINRNAAEVVTAQPALKKVIAEMGGKNATIVDTDADLDEAVKGVVYSAFGYAGQKCSACSRAIVLDGVYDRFVPRLIEAARSVQVGPAEDPGTFVPPVIDKNAWESIRKYVEIGKGEAKLGLEVDVRELVQRTGGYFIGPTIFVDVDPNARIAKEEIFGPVLAVIRARDMDHAIDIFNNVDYALTGGIFSRSPANIERARHECDCGNFYINRKISGALVDVQPFGGFKMSGIGSKAGGPDYLIQFCEPRCITENTLRRGFAPSEEVAEALG
ncbi:MAG: L-glutamate gamma-semialdehyde dehydrogenase [Phycisphaerae bacterium]